MRCGKAAQDGQRGALCCLVGLIRSLSLSSLIRTIPKHSSAQADIGSRHSLAMVNGERPLVWRL